MAPHILNLGTVWHSVTRLTLLSICDLLLGENPCFLLNRSLDVPLSTFWKRYESINSAGNRTTVPRLSSPESSHYID